MRHYIYFTGKRKRASNKKSTPQSSSRSRTPLSVLDDNTSSPAFSLDSNDLISPALSIASSTAIRSGSRSNRSGSRSNPRSSKLKKTFASLNKDKRKADSPAFDLSPGFDLDDNDAQDFVNPQQKFAKSTDFMCGLDESSGSASEGEGEEYSKQSEQPPSRRRKTERPRAVVTEEMLQGLIEEPKQINIQSDISSDELPDLLS